MSVLHYIDNEVPAFGEWTSVTENGGSTIVQSAAATFPERGSLGLRTTIVGANTAYAVKDVSISIDAAGSVWVGFWLRMAAFPAVIYPLKIYSAAPNCLLRVGLTSSGWVMGKVYNDAGAVSTVYSTWAIGLDRWTYIAVELRRASTNIAADGGVALYVGGELVDSRYDVDNFDRATDVGELCAGVVSVPQDGTVVDLDEFKIATAYPEPHSPTPADEYPSAARTVVLWRRASSDSREFADYCVTELGVPRANLCPLPNASASETLADYATFQAQVETDLAAWLAVNPTIAANCSCFLVGYGVPGYFTSGGEKHSATSRLMNCGTAFSSQTANPLYLGSTGVPPVRLTKTALGGKYLATRIDADTLANAKGIVDCGLQIVNLTALPETDKLYSDGATYRASLSCQKLRMIAAALDTYADDAFVWGDTGSPAFGAAGSRVCFADNSADSADTLRAASELFTAMVTNGYAAGLGFSATPCTPPGGPGGLRPTPFFEMLRLGGTFAEAVAVAAQYLDYTTVAAGSPLMTVVFQLGGYDLYSGIGTPEAIDREQPTAYLREGEQTRALQFAMIPGIKYVLSARAVSPSGVQECNSHVLAYAEIDDLGQLSPPPLSRNTDVTAKRHRDGYVVVGFSYRADFGFAAADAFDILSDSGTGTLNLDTPVANVSDVDPRQTEFEVVVPAAALPAMFSVRARVGDQTGPISRIVTVAAGPAASPPTLL